MRVHGHRECQACGERWSYFATGDVACPACGSMRSVGTDADRRLHTATPTSLELADARQGLGGRPLREVADEAAEATREYVLAAGFIDAGELQALDDVFVAAAELRQVAGTLRRRSGIGPDAEAHFVALLEGAPKGERPEAVPATLRPARGRGLTDATRAYRADLRTWLDAHPDERARRLLGRLRDQERRIRALEGDVPPADAEAVLAGVRAIGAYLREGDDAHLGAAEAALRSLP